jgi:hypothetical protein
MQLSWKRPQIEYEMSRHVVDEKERGDNRTDPLGPSSARKETRRIGSYPWFSKYPVLYHTQICHSESCHEFLGQSDSCLPT